MSNLIEKAPHTHLKTHFTEQTYYPNNRMPIEKNSQQTAILNICDNMWTNMENKKNSPLSYALISV